MQKNTIKHNTPYFPKSTLYDEEEHQQLLSYYDDHQLDNLSLRDLPIAAAAVEPPPPHQQKTTAPASATANHSRHSSTSSSSNPTSDFFFEFLINNDDDLITSTADDVIFHGRLLPYAPPQPRPRRSLSLSSAAARLTRPQPTESPAESAPSIRPSRSLNCYRKLSWNRSNAKPKNEVIYKNSWKNSSSSNNHLDKTPAKLPWYSALVFGLPKVPAEMELKDIKNRQFRRSSTPPPPPSRLLSGGRNCSSGSWKVLNVLSCKSHATVDVTNTAPFRNSLT